MFKRISDLYGRFRAFSTDSANIPKTGKFCRSRPLKFAGPVKFGEKSQIIKPTGNHPYYFLERSDGVQQAIRLVGSV